jgi:ABC-type nitrate/sulfonate/bicarbonate transport system substrate-binding protein
VRNPGKFKIVYAIDDELAKSIGVKQIYTLGAAHEDFAKANPQLLKKMFEVWSAAAAWANANMSEAISLLAKPVASGGTGLPPPVLESQLITHRTLRWDIVKAADIATELFKEFDAYAEIGAITRVPDKDIIYKGL